MDWVVNAREEIERRSWKKWRKSILHIDIRAQQNEVQILLNLKWIDFEGNKWNILGFVIERKY